MWVSIILGLASSIEIPIHMTKSEGSIEIPQIMFAGKDSQASTIVTRKFKNFYVKVNIGGQEFNLTLDILTGETRVALNTCRCTYNAEYYDPSKSLYSKDVSISNNSYDSSSEKYKLFTDKMALNTLTVEQQYFLGVATHSYYPESISGSLGLGNSNNLKNENFLKNLYFQGKIDEQVFSLTLKNPYKPTHDSVLSVGKYNFSSYSNGKKTKITPDQDYGSWSTYVSSLSLDSKLISSKNIPALFVPSLPFIILPPIEYRKLMNDILNIGCGFRGIWLCQCNPEDYLRFPDLNLKIDGNVYTLYPEDYVFYISGYCYIGVLDIGIEFYGLGSPFFYHYYTVFDMKESIITIAPAIDFTLRKESSVMISYSNFGIIGAACLGLLAWKIKKNKMSEDYRDYEPMALKDS